MPDNDLTEVIDTTIKDRLDQLIDKAPAHLKPLAIQYGPALVQWTTEELWQWIDLLARGKWEEAQASLLASLDEPDLLAEFESINEDMADANVINAQQRSMMRDAAIAILKGVMVIALAMVGL